MRISQGRCYVYDCPSEALLIAILQRVPEKKQADSGKTLNMALSPLSQEPDGRSLGPDTSKMDAKDTTSLWGTPFISFSLLTTSTEPEVCPCQGPGCHLLAWVLWRVALC